MAKHVYRNKGVSRKEAMNIKYGSNENIDLHYGRGFYVDEHDNMNHKDMNEDLCMNRDTNDHVSIGQSKKKVKDTNNHSRIAKLPSANCKGLYNPSLSLHQVGDHMQGLLQHLQGA